MANWATQKNPQKFTNSKGFDENDMMMMGVMQSQKPGFNDLIQNCDLPPPTKVFSGFSDNVTVINPINRKIGNQDDDDDDYDDKERKLGLLKALRLSQTRAREAEAKYAAITKEKDAISFAFVRDSMQIFAYKQFVRLLEFEVSQLQQQQQCGKTKQEQTDDDDDDDDRLTWLITMAFCLGIAGVGLAFGCKYFHC